MLASTKGRDFLLVSILLWAVSSPSYVYGQRAILNLGKRIFKRGGTSDRNKGEQNKDSKKGSKESNVEVPLSFWIAVTGTILGILYIPTLLENELKKTKDNCDTAPLKDDQFIIQDVNDTSRVKMDQIDLSFEGIRMTLETKNSTRILLDGSFRGRARPGRMLAIMGPSGAGKSTLLHAVAGRIKESSKLSLEGHRYINGHPIAGDTVLPSAFIEQEAVFFPHMTVRETLNFRVELKLGRLTSKGKRDEIVNDLMDQVGLKLVADTIVGDSNIRGISGGERKRLSIAVEMINSPNLVFLDEPSSGLDSTAAMRLIQTLRNLADQGKTVIAVIHQPSQHLFSKFDDILLVSEGKQMYFGERKDVRAYMEQLGFPAADEIGTAEHVLDCISRQQIEDETLEEASARVENIAQAAAFQQTDLGLINYKDRRTMTALAKILRPRSGLLTQFRLLFKRSFREVARGKVAFIIKMVQQVTMGIVYGGIFSLGTNQASIQDRFGLLSLIVIGAGNIAMAGSIRAFPKEKAIVSNELASAMYNTLPYFIGKALSELPLVGLLNAIHGAIVYKLTGLSGMKGKFGRFLGILSLHGLASEATGLLIGAISPNSDVALAILPAVFVLNAIFDGKNISEENIPVLLRWIPKIGIIRWAFEGLCVNEFEGLEFDVSGPRRGPIAKTGAEALARFGLGGNALSDVIQAQATITLVCWFMSYLGLSLTRQRFMMMQTPIKTSNND